MTLDNFYRLKYSDSCLLLHCYTTNVSADMSFGFLQVFSDRSREPTQSLEMKSFFNPRGYIVLLPLTMTEYKS